MAAVVGLAACGGGDSPAERPQPQPLVKREFIERGDALCRERQDKFAAIQGPQGAETFEGTAKQAGQLVDVGEDVLRRFRQLSPPPEERERFRRYLAASREALQSIREAKDAAARIDPKALRDAERNNRRASRRAATIAREIGFEVCGRAG